MATLGLVSLDQRDQDVQRITLGSLRQGIHEALALGQGAIVVPFSLRFTIVSKDSDLHQRSLVFGPPPKLIWLRVGNGPTSQLSS